MIETSADVYFDGRRILGDHADLGFRAVDFHPGEWTLSEEERHGTFVTLIVERLVPAIEPLGSREGLIDFVRSRNAVRELTIDARRELGFPEDV
ncbi:MAG: hypothetical protein KAS72_14490 [Phycisphaerales bacterium]|nr:hypothetical protein [Phycisphaerales bacterium]